MCKICFGFAFLLPSLILFGKRLILDFFLSHLSSGFLPKGQLFYFSKQKLPLLTAKLNSFRQIGWILLRKECALKFEYHQGGNMDGWIPKGRVQIKADTCSNMNNIYGFFDQKSSRQYHYKDIHRKSLIQFYCWVSFFGRLQAWAYLFNKFPPRLFEDDIFGLDQSRQDILK